MAEHDPRDITTDHETIRAWVEDRGGTPAHETGQADDTARTLYIIEEGEEMTGLDPISWDEFFEAFEDEELAFVYQDRELGETDEWLYDLIDREEAAERATLETPDVEAALLDGEVVRSELTETKVIETTVVETDQIESEVVDSEIIERRVVDREPVGRELVGIEFTDAPTELPASLSTDQQDVTQRLGSEIDEVDRSDQSTLEAHTEAGLEPKTEAGTESETEAGTEPETESRETMGTETGSRTETDEPVAQPVDETTAGPATDRERSIEPTPGLGVGSGVVLDVHETVLTTTEVFDRKTVESRVVEQEITEEGTVESDAIDIEGIEERLLESDVIEGEIVTDETGETAGVPSGAITSELTEGETIRSQFVERRLVETESTDHHRLGCEITDYELVDIVEDERTIVERAIVDRETDEAAMLKQPEAGVRTSDEQITAAEESATAPTADAELAAEQAGEAGGTGAAGETGATGETDEVESAKESTAKAAVTDDEVGKRVVSGGEEIGIVSDVDTESQTLYVEPEPSLADRIKAAFDWGDTDDSYPVTEDQIEAVEDDEVRVSER